MSFGRINVDKTFSQQSLIEYGTLKDEDFKLIDKCRGVHNKLGLAYQLIFTKLFNTLPQQRPFEVIEEIAIYASLQLSIDPLYLASYQTNRKKLGDHQQQVVRYLEKKPFTNQAKADLEHYIFDQALQLEPLSLLHIKGVQFLRQHHTLSPSLETLRRLVATQRKKARQHIFTAIYSRLTPEIMQALNELLVVHKGLSQLEFLKKPPQRASAEGALNLVERLDLIRSTKIIGISLSDINNNYQRTLTHETKRISVNRLRTLTAPHRYAALTCFLHQSYKDTIDFLIETYGKIMNRSYTHADNQMTKQIKKEEQVIKQSLENYEKVKVLVRDRTLQDSQLRQAIYEKLGKEAIEDETSMVSLLTGKYRSVFKLFTHKYSYFRRFMPQVLDHIDLHQDPSSRSDVIEALEVLKEANKNHKRKLPLATTPTEFISQKLNRVVFEENGDINRHAWECALYTKVYHEIKTGNLSVKSSKRYIPLDDFFMPMEQWLRIKDSFFERSKLPSHKKDVTPYIMTRLDQAYEVYFQHEPHNGYAKVEKDKWVLSNDPAASLDTAGEEALKRLHGWLLSKARMIKLPDLLIEIDNDLHFSDLFLLPKHKDDRLIDDICDIIMTILAHGCNIGIYTMSKLVQGASYERMKRITDWQLTEDALRVALSWVVNAISKLEISRVWGDGTTSSSDGHLKSFSPKVLQQNYSPRFGDFALEFYTFVADNYAPFYSKPIECNEGEATHVLDGLLYNESDLPLYEHFTDTRAAATITFTAFCFLGRLYNPRIRGLQNHHIFKVDKNKDHHSLETLLHHRESLINVTHIEDYWEQMARFYAGIEYGHSTASVALRRILSLGQKNEFYRANLLFGRVLKTEYILHHMIDPERRQRKRRGLLKGEQMHQLARDISYGERGKITRRDFQAQRTCCSCLTLIMACIVYWQAKEISRIVGEHVPPPEINLALLVHVSPIGWGNVILYGEYVIDRSLVRRKKVFSF